MKPHSLHSRHTRAFSLLELLLVLAIIAILVALSTLGLRGISSSGNFNNAVTGVSGILEQARSYAIAQDTYVWVALYENIPANGGPHDVYVGAFASGDGTDPFNWTGSVTIPPGTVTVGGTTTTLNQILRIYHFKGLHLETTTMPNAPNSPNTPATSPVFQCTAQSDSGPVTLSGTSTVYWIIQFTPSGAARNSSSTINSIWFGLQPSLSPTLYDQHNIASLSVSGLTGMTIVNRL